jgi:parallel beta-helix repeat protein
MRLHRAVAVAAAVVAGVSSLAAVSGAHAATTITVPAMQPTIQAGINAALPGDTVLVSPGTYRENIVFPAQRQIVVESSSGPATTIIDGGGAGPVASFAGSTSQPSVLQGFTLRNGTTTTGINAAGGGVSVFASVASILDNVITGNGGCDGAGVALEFADALVQGNTISHNATSCTAGDGGGIEVRGFGATQVIGNTITGNTSDFGGGIALVNAGSPTIENNVVEGNSATNAGGGLYAVQQSDANVVQTSLRRIRLLVVPVSTSHPTGALAARGSPTTRWRATPEPHYGWADSIRTWRSPTRC